MIKSSIMIKPLSVNKAWQGRRFKTKEYKYYEEKALWLLKGAEKVKGWVNVKYTFFLKNYKASDVGNFEKPLTDIIVKAGMIDDDRFIKEIIIRKVKSEIEGINIEIYEADTN